MVKNSQYFICSEFCFKLLYSTSSSIFSGYSCPVVPQIETQSVTDKSVNITWQSKYNGGSKQHFEVSYEEKNIFLPILVNENVPDPGFMKNITMNINFSKSSIFYLVYVKPVNSYVGKNPCMPASVQLFNLGKVFSDFY
jgi:hypothetical protein